MRHEVSCGIIPLKKNSHGWSVLLVQHNPGSWWGFPKGHMEPGEGPKETAERELQEETGLHPIRWIDHPEIVEVYQFQRKGRRIQKKVIYFFAEVDGLLRIQPNELVSARWVAITQAESLATFEGMKRICREICACLDKMLPSENP